jgi:RNA polymerase sigma factor (TIGR02999 family)
MSDVTHLLDAAAAGDRQAAADLLPLVYDELRKLAAARMAAESPEHTLQPTALVHEAYLRLVGRGDANRWDNRGHFFAAAAEAMRRILVEAARRKRRAKHGGERQRMALDATQIAAPDARHDLLALDAALTRLEAEDPQAAKLVELRHFTGLSVAEAALALGISPRTADRIWAFARAWLHRELAAGVSRRVRYLIGDSMLYQPAYAGRRKCGVIPAPRRIVRRTPSNRHPRVLPRTSP